MWVGRTELTVRQFSALTYYRPAGNRGQENPVNGIVWNDMLAGCLNFPLLESLPPGYIVRPLTEDEWEYCALGGMHKAPETEEWTKERDKREAQRVASFSANFFGLYDMLGNVNEMVLSAKCSRPGSYVVRGGDFMTERSRALTGRKEVAFYQAWMPTTGVRLAVAPGTPEVLKHEIRTGEACHLVVNGRHYEFFGHFLANFDRNRAEKLCMLLGGHLAILDPPEVWQEIRRRSSPVVSYPVVVGAEFRDGCWRWRDGRPVEGAPRQLSKQGGALLLLEGKYTLQSFSRCCGFVCEWSEEEWRLRGEWRSRTRGKQLLHEFRMGDREYALFAACQCCPHLMRRFAEILGGRLAEPETPEDRRRLAAELRAFEDLPILLGGIRLPEGFRWLTDGRRIEGTLMQEGILYDQARSLDAPALLKGRLCAIQSSARLLVEFPASAPTRR